MSLLEVLLLVGAGLLGGAMNAAAGGGTFFIFPALHAVGLPLVTAAATTAVAEWPGHAAAAAAYRETLRETAMPWLLRRCGLVVLGGILGAVLLISIGESAFGVIVPWMILLSTLLFACGDWLRLTLSRSRRWGPRLLGGGPAMEFLAGVYGGFFGAGLGVLLLAVATVFDHAGLQRANALKNLLAACATSVALLIFLFSGIVDGTAAAIVVAGAVLGAVLGARWVQHVPEAPLRFGVVLLGLCLSAIYFFRAHGGG